jgi:hypothetical protein
MMRMARGLGPKFTRVTDRSGRLIGGLPAGKFD